ncbi:uncharacterized protein LOC126897535 [Daktulosphaira vitifoliae]|uniref:uncharacterized protein LOC126897535 n=1 Tax=Daktulosphaira vitifoliae TaxID=58002 RepID=UPI0021AAC13E|nr:uncharacterized protein LOC126897535 [Daktulosphaira vitifoliae]XP_050527174.1 uncharacterized protein LOC126897535 [Daktulosphaira vitifoliae]
MRNQSLLNRLGLIMWTISVLIAVSDSSSVEKEVGLLQKPLNNRVKRQLPPLSEGDQVVDNIFMIPISTLNAVGSLIKSTRPIIRRTRERIQQFYNQQQQRPMASQFVSNKPSFQQSYFNYNVNRPRPNINRNRPQGRGLSDYSDY